ncbi:MAG: aspartate--tRNA ligase [Synergistaceae bacterium]|jgi:aspartyl-tRNA synthetase|nr:aspartate--tRNA ligase [Synergistaceae bacterium]
MGSAKEAGRPEFFDNYWKRSSLCGHVGEDAIGEEIKVNGWVRRRRDLGGIIFIELWDHSGPVQIVFDPDSNPDAGGVHVRAGDLRSEYCIAVRGKVTRRPEGTENPALATGKVEVAAEDFLLLAPSEPLPFEVGDATDKVDENLRLAYRYLDLRRERMQNNLRTRSKLYTFTRNFLADNDFVEIETPMLTKATPEGARDYLVPSRVNPGAFYALPQSPQLFKQILMVSGFDRYYQIVKCFRDEDLRADRQPEFTQVDVEMSYVVEDDVMTTIEGYMKGLFKTILDEDVPTPFRRMDYWDAIDLYGSDKPDLRIPMELVDLAPVFREGSFEPFRKILESDGAVRALPLPGGASLSRKELSEIEERAKKWGASGLGVFQMKENELKGPLVKFMNEEERDRLKKIGGLGDGDALFVVADPSRLKACTVLGTLRLDLGKTRGLIDEKGWKFLWVVRFPLFEWDEEARRWSAMHHPFTSPVLEQLDLMETDPGKVLARAYDIVLNGSEVGGGSIRIHDPAVQRRAFACLGIGEEQARERFGFFLDALSYGTPPHGGIALGVDRLAMILCGGQSIRDVMAFPKTQKAQCLLSRAPDAVEESRLEELHIRCAPVEN